ncbi:hypothetical protein SM033_00090 [Vibrio phage vB_VpaM_sm033]|nr:hypothetical protein SM033_00090 [Vibrio phage vB_VpaM_sm033]
MEVMYNPTAIISLIVLCVFFLCMWWIVWCCYSDTKKELSSTRSRNRELERKLERVNTFIDLLDTKHCKGPLRQLFQTGDRADHIIDASKSLTDVTSYIPVCYIICGQVKPQHLKMFTTRCWVYDNLGHHTIGQNLTNHVYTNKAIPGWTMAAALVHPDDIKEVEQYLVSNHSRYAVYYGTGQGRFNSLVRGRGADALAMDIGEAINNAISYHPLRNIVETAFKHELETK